MYELDVVSPDSLGWFVSRWYGPPDRPPAPAADSTNPWTSAPTTLTPPAPTEPTLVVPAPAAPAPTVSAPTAPAKTVPASTAPAPTVPGPTALAPTVPAPTVLAPTAAAPTVPSLAGGLAVPEPLLEWHRLAARYTYPLSRDHVILPLPTEPPRNGTIRFWQGTDDWYSYDNEAFRSGVADPEVIENDEFPTGLTLSRFLVYAAVYEATYAPLHGLVCMNPSPEGLHAVKVRLRELDDNLWQWPDPETHYYGDDDLLGHLGPDRIVLAARHRDALGRFDGLALPWDWDTRTL